MTELDYLEETHTVATEGEDRVTLMTIVRVLRSYATPILLSVLAAIVAYIILAVIYLLVSPTQRNTRLGFRLEFPGADVGQYPNGVKFSGGDIIDTPVLRAAFDANQLDRYISFSDFSRSVVVLETNGAVEQLAREYEAKLANPKLSPIERQRLEAEYDQKRDSLRKNEFSLILTTREGLTRIPPSVAAKTLSDILRIWAEFAAKTRQVLAHRVPLVSEQALSRLGTSDRDLLGSLLALRTTALELQTNIDDLKKLPGAEVIRSTKRDSSLRELELELAQIERNGIEFMITEVLRNGVIDRSRAAAMIDAQLEFDRRALQASEERVNVLRTALEDYAQQRGESVKDVAEAGQTQTATPPNENAVVLSDSFLERIVALAQDAADRSYRQRQVEEIKMAALAAVPLRSTVAYEERLLQDLRSGAAVSRSVSVDTLTAERDRIVQRLGSIAEDLMDIRSILSRSLTASGQMYTVTAPPVAVTERSVSLSRLALGGILIVILTALAAIAAAFIHHRMQIERVSPA